MIKLLMLKEALASCRIEGIGKDISLKDLLLEDALNKERGFEDAKR